MKAYLAGKAAVVDKALDREMPSESAPPALLHKAMRYSVFSGGKRLRPVLCLAAAETIRAGAEPVAIWPAMAVELFHTYTLIHDDLPSMDNDDLRRGKPTSHKVFGEANAILAGDALQAMAFEFVARAGESGLAPVADMILELAAAGGSRGVAGGQVEDLAVTRSQPSKEAIEWIHLHKTADLFRAAVKLGGMAAGATSGQLDLLGEYGINLGLAFQITDDLLDSSDSEPVGKDTSCLSVYDRQTAKDKAAAHIAGALDAVSSLETERGEPLAAVARSILHRKT